MIFLCHDQEYDYIYSRFVSELAHGLHVPVFGLAIALDSIYNLVEQYS